jgi:gluconate 2-dehydrogenase gamma chain
MSKQKNCICQRRRFLQAALAAGAGGAISCSGEKSRWRSLRIAEAETAAAICDQLIPEDEFAGAAAGGAVDYLDRQLSGHLRKYRQLYRTGLAGVEDASREKYRTGFVLLAPAQRLQLLKLIEKGNAPAPGWDAAAQRQFFAAILSHTMQSYYGDPRHGGNRDGVGYRSIGLTLTPVRGRSKHDVTQAGCDPSGRPS